MTPFEEVHQQMISMAKAECARMGGVPGGLPKSDYGGTSPEVSDRAERISDFLRGNPESTLGEISRGIDVPPERLKNTMLTMASRGLVTYVRQNKQKLLYSLPGRTSGLITLEGETG
ncbi:MAG: hypothetical protein ACPGFA_01270 [Pikeienuella sp.]